MNKGCLAVYSSTFADASNIISSLNSGKLKAKIIDTEILVTYNFCIKVRDATGLTFTVDDLSLQIIALPP